MTRFLAAAPWLLPIAMAAFVWMTVVNVPMFDEWLWAPLIVKMHDGTLTLADIWAQQNVHRSFFPTLIALGLAKIFGWNTRIEAVASVALVALTQFTLYRFLRGRLEPKRAAVAFAIGSVLLYSLAQSENWAWGFQLSWFLVNLCVVVISVVIPSGAQGSRGTALIVAICAAIVASYSLIFGLGAWIAGALVLRGRHLLIWLVFAAATLAFYLRGFVLPQSESGWLHGLIAAGDAIQFFLAYLGAPLGIVWGRFACEAFGIALIVASHFAYHRVRKISPPLGAFALSMFAFTIVAAALETAGRAVNGPDAAVVSRYTTTATLAWIALAISLCAIWPRFARARTATFVSAGAFIALLLVLDVTGWVNTVVLAAFQETALETIAGIDRASDDDILMFSNGPRRLRREIAALRRVREGPFARQDWGHTGRR
jgi:hypothetical protein